MTYEQGLAAMIVIGAICIILAILAPSSFAKKRKKNKK